MLLLPTTLAIRIDESGVIAMGENGSGTQHNLSIVIGHLSIVIFSWD
jgi:hypothetical protein